MALEDDIRFSSAEINVVIHATENENKILHSINNALSISTDKFLTTTFAGQWGNKIMLLTVTINSRAAKDLVLKIISSLNSVDRNLFSNFFDKYIDEKGTLYIRLDKQRICQGKISLSENDSIRIRFRPVRRYKPINDLQNYRGFFSSIG